MKKEPLRSSAAPRRAALSCRADRSRLAVSGFLALNLLCCAALPKNFLPQAQSSKAPL